MALDQTSIRTVAPEKYARLKRWAMRKPCVALMGEFSAGKSTLLNFLIEEELLPTKATATELPPVWFSYGDETCFWVDQDWVAHELDPRDLTAVPPDARFARLFLKADLLEACDIIDTPGISDPNLVSESWRMAAGLSNMVLWCTSATQAWRESERSTWASLPERLHKNSILVVTRADKLLTETDRGKVGRRMAREASDLFSGIVFMSTLDAVKAKAAMIMGEETPLWEQSGGADLIERMSQQFGAIAADRRRMLDRYRSTEGEGSLKMPVRPVRRQTEGSRRAERPSAEEARERFDRMRSEDAPNTAPPPAVEATPAPRPEPVAEIVRPEPEPVFEEPIAVQEEPAVQDTPEPVLAEIEPDLTTDDYDVASVDDDTVADQPEVDVEDVEPEEMAFEEPVFEDASEPVFEEPVLEEITELAVEEPVSELSETPVVLQDEPAEEPISLHDSIEDTPEIVLSDEVEETAALEDEVEEPVSEDFAKIDEVTAPIQPADIQDLVARPVANFAPANDTVASIEDEFVEDSEVVSEDLLTEEAELTDLVEAVAATDEVSEPEVGEAEEDEATLEPVADMPEPAALTATVPHEVLLWRDVVSRHPQSADNPLVAMFDEFLTELYSLSEAQDEITQDEVTPPQPVLEVEELLDEVEDTADETEEQPAPASTGWRRLA